MDWRRAHDALCESLYLTQSRRDAKHRKEAGDRGNERRRPKTTRNLATAASKFLFLRGERGNSSRRSGLYEDITEYYRSFSHTFFSCVFFLCAPLHLCVKKAKCVVRPPLRYLPSIVITTQYPHAVNLIGHDRSQHGKHGGEDHRIVRPLHLFRVREQQRSIRQQTGGGHE